MLVITSFAISLCASALAMAVPRPHSLRRPYDTRDDSDSNAFPTDQDVLNTCPGGPGSNKLPRANNCTLINIVDNPNPRTFTILGDPQLNCGGGTDPVTMTIGGNATIAQTTAVDADSEPTPNNGTFIVTFPQDASICGGVTDARASSVTLSNSTQYSIPPGKQAVLVAGTAQRSQTGNIQATYTDTQYLNAISLVTTVNVTQLTPISDDVQLDVYESDCGTDPRDLSNFHPTSG